MLTIPNVPIMLNSSEVARASIKHNWNAMQDNDAVRREYYGPSYSYKPDATVLAPYVDRSIISGILNRIAIDVSALEFKHVRVNQNEQYEETLKTGLNNCLAFYPNLDQIPQQFKMDMVLSMLTDKDGVIGVVPTDTTINPKLSGSYDIKSLRVGEITQWMPEHIKIKVYNQKTCIREEITLPKSMVAIVENPLRTVMNTPNSILQRLLRKLDLLDVVDEQAGSNKLDVLVQLPYGIKSEMKRNEANKRLAELERQMNTSKLGIGYIDGTERVIQLNRPVENNILNNIQYLTAMLYGELGITENVMKGIAEESEMLNYFNRIIEPIATAISSAFTKTFITPTGRSQGQRVMFFRNPFKLVPALQFADIADKLTRNEILSSNEVRGEIGYVPSSEERANQLINKNIAHPDGEDKMSVKKKGEENQNGSD